VLQNQQLYQMEWMKPNAKNDLIMKHPTLLCSLREKKIEIKVTRNKSGD